MSIFSRWDRFFFESAFLAARQSRDISTQVGAVIVRDKRVLVSGYNGPPKGFPDYYEGLRGEEKNQLTIHAELNAILNANRFGVDIQNSDLYVTLRPCSQCALMVANSGIRNIVYHKEAQDYYEKIIGNTWGWDMTSKILTNTSSITSELGLTGDISVQLPILIRGTRFIPSHQSD